MGKSTIGIICGGSGSSKFATAFDKHFRLNNHELGFIVNASDNFWHFGVYVCPDVDIITHALAARLDEAKGWGVKSDTFNFLKTYKQIEGSEDWFNLGDSDLALSIRRTELMNYGWNLSQVTDYFRNLFDIRHAIIPATNDSVQTFILTTAGRFHLQEYWVKHQASPRVRSVEYVGLENAELNSEAIKFLSNKVVILPANPITSIMPTLSLRGVRQKLRNSKVLAISPFVGTQVFSGPAAKLMQGLGIECTSLGVAMLYADFLKVFLVDMDEDHLVIQKIKDLGIECIKTNIRIKSNADKQSIVREI